MKKFALVLIMCLAIIACLGTISVFAEEGTTSGPTHTAFNDHINGHLDEGLAHTHKYNKEGKDLEELKIKVGAKGEGVVKFTDKLRVDVEGKKDIHKTNAKEGWEGEALLVYKKTFLDLSGFFGE